MNQRLARIREAFAKQAGDFGAGGTILTNPDHLGWMIGALPLRPDSVVLDLAGGTGILARALARHVQAVTVFDASEAMLAEGRRQADADRLSNIRFLEGDAAALPFADRSFDLVVSRFTVHHFADPAAVLAEGARVCRGGGHCAVIDIVSPSDPVLAATYNLIERLRDPSHIRCLAPEELTAAVAAPGLEVLQTASRRAEVSVDRWLALSKTPPAVAAAIRDLLHRDLAGESATGLQPFDRGGDLCFHHHMYLALAHKH